MGTQDIEKTLSNRVGHEIDETTMVKGVEFAVFTNDDGEKRYYPYLLSGELVTETPLSDVYSRGNYTLGRTADTGQEVMIDDDGVHFEW